MNIRWVPFQSSVSTGLEEEFRHGQEEEKLRRARFPERFPGIGSVPLINRGFAAIYAHGFPYVLALILSIVVFTAIKAPYLRVPLTGQHSMKYNTYVEPALHMVQKDSMLWNQKKYVADPVRNPEGIFMKFSALPLMEWGLYLTYRLFPDAGIEVKTRVFAHILGVVILLCVYRFLCGYFPKSFIVLFIGLLAINPVFSFSTYITVLDSIILIFMFLSLRRIGAYYERRDISGLWWAGIWFGLGNAVKYPLFLWLAPITFLFMYHEEDNPVSFLKNYAIYISVSLLVTFAAVSISRKIIVSPSIAATLALGLGITLWIIRRILSAKENTVLRLFERIWGRKAILGAVSVVSIGAAIFLFRFLRLSDFSDEFLADWGLATNYRMYKYMLFNQFKEYMTRNLFWFGLSGTALALLTRESPMRRVWVPFLLGSLVYWAIASKAIFFHIYYSLIIVFTLTFAAAYLVHFVARSMKDLPQKAIITMFFFSLILPPALDATSGRMKNYAKIDNVVRFINENTKPDEFLLFEGFLTSLSIYTGRGFVMPAVLINNVVREDIHKIGFANTMRKYKIRYLITPKEQPYYPDYAPIFESTTIKEPSGRNFNRSISIYKAIGSPGSELSDDLRRVEEIVRTYRIQDKFVLAAEVDRFRFYTFQN